MKFAVSAIFAIVTACTPVCAEIYFKEKFNDADWKKRWTISSDWKSSAELGEWEHTAGKWYGDKEDGMGIQTSENARFYGISAKLDKPYVSGEGKDLVVQYAVKHEQKLDCGGAYIKLLPGGSSFKATKFGGDTPYAVMFGPDICGSSNKRTHVILHYPKKTDNLLIKKDVKCETDNFSHLYTLVVRPDNSFEVFIDEKSVRSGKLDAEFDFLEPKKIKDPEASKPDDWVDEEEIPDPEDIKPEGYDDIPPEIADPDAEKPEDWDDEDDGEWEAPMIDNPEYKGPWKPKMIPNPEFKGKWEHPMIANPDYEFDDSMYAVCKDGCTHIGFELWQVTSGTHFDDIIITDSIEEAQAFAQETFFKKKDPENKMRLEIEEEERKEREAEEDEAGFDDDEVLDDGFEDEF